MILPPFQTRATPLALLSCLLFPPCLPSFLYLLFPRTTGSSRPYAYSYCRWPRYYISWQIDRPTQHLQPTPTKIVNRTTDRPTPTAPEVVSVGGLSTCNSIIYSQSPASKSLKPFLLAAVGEREREREGLSRCVRLL